MKTLDDAKKDLYDKLRVYGEVVGAGTRSDNTIVIFLTRKKKSVTKKIPSTYEGYKVFIEITGIISMRGS